MEAEFVFRGEDQIGLNISFFTFACDLFYFISFIYLFILKQEF